MSPVLIGLSGIGVLLILLMVRIPVAFAMFAVGFAGIWYLNGLKAAIGLLSSETFALASNAELIMVPLCILMGNVVSATGMSRKLYEAAYAIIGRVRGGLAAATAVASALTMGRTALSEMDRFGDSPCLYTGVVAAGGTLGIPIPPSTGFVIYAILTQQSIGRLFMAGVIPGLLLLTAFLVTVPILCAIFPEMGSSCPATDRAQKIRAFLGAVPILLVVLTTIVTSIRGSCRPPRRLV